MKAHCDVDDILPGRIGVYDFQGNEVAEIVYRDVEEVRFLQRWGGICADMVFFLRDGSTMQDFFGGFYQAFNKEHPPPPARTPAPAPTAPRTAARTSPAPHSHHPPFDDPQYQAVWMRQLCGRRREGVRDL